MFFFSFSEPRYSSRPLPPTIQIDHPRPTKLLDNLEARGLTQLRETLHRAVRENKTQSGRRQLRALPDVAYEQCVYWINAVRGREGN